MATPPFGGSMMALGKEPGLAKSWEANDDKTEWTFHLP